MLDIVTIWGDIRKERLNREFNGLSIKSDND